MRVMAELLSIYIFDTSASLFYESSFKCGICFTYRSRWYCIENANNFVACLAITLDNEE